MGLSIAGHPQEKWEMDYLCRLPRTEQGNTKRSFPSPIYRSSPRYLGREVTLFLPKWLQWLQSDSDHP